MPAINVARTDTFEIQRQKINQIGDQIFSISQGGSDLATGNLKLGDGTRTAPSLAFTTDSDLGIYKNDLASLGFVSGGKKLFDISEFVIKSYKDFILEKKTLLNSGVTILSGGQNYDSGSFTDIPLKSGSGVNATADVTVVGFGGSITNSGKNYVSGSYSILFSGGTGTGSEGSIVVSGATYQTNNSGSGYGGAIDLQGDPIVVYNNVPLSGGSGSGAIANITLDPSTGSIDFFTIINSGKNYLQGDLLTVDNQYLNNQGSGFEIVLTNTPGQVESINFVNYGSGYQVGDILTLPQYQLNFSNVAIKSQVLNVSTTLSTLTATITVSDTSGIIAGMEVTATTGPGSIIAGTTVLSVDSSTELTLSQNPDADGTAVLNFVSPGDLSEIQLPSVSGIEQNSIVTITGGSGVLQSDTRVSFIDSINNTITLSKTPSLAGTSDIQIVPPYGSADIDFEFTISSVGVIETIIINNVGSGYFENDILLVDPSDLTQPITYDVYVNPIQELTFSSTIPSGTFNVGDQLNFFGGTIDTFNIVSAPAILSEANNSYTITSYTTSGVGIDLTLFVDRDSNGAINSISILNPGRFFDIGDTITISGSVVGGSSPSQDIVLSVTNITPIGGTIEVYSVNESTNLISLVIEDVGIQSQDYLEKGGNRYQVNTATNTNKFFIDTGSGSLYLPDLTLYVGNKYIFDISDSSNSSHPFSLSKFRDGIWSPSLIENISSTLDVSSTQITVSNTTGILPGMVVEVSSGNGQLDSDTEVESVVDSTTIVLSKSPTVSGTSILTFKGKEYTDGVTRSADKLEIVVSPNTPNLYYYCSSHPDMGGVDNEESLITINPNNPKIFGSGFQLLVTDIDSTEIIKSDVDTGNFNAIAGSFDTVSATNSSLTNIQSTSITVSGSLDTSSITSSSPISISTNTLNVSGTTNIGSNIILNSSDGNITTSGILRTNGQLNVNNILKIIDNTISTSSGYDVIISPPSGRIAKINSTSAFVVPVGTDLERPQAPLAQNGSIRFNTVNNQYEGYSSANSSWSSLGGVRDIDGNTYILAELTAGANDNTLWFYNDNSNTLKLTTTFLDFRSVKKISSGKLGLPSFTLWSANTPVNIGQYLKYRNNLYEVTAAGTTASSGNEPTHISGVENNGTAQLTWYSSTVSPLEFSEVEELRVGPNKDCPLIVSSEIKLFNNTISTLFEDLVLSPNSGKKVSINSTTSLVIPSGNTNQRGSASRGSIRFNTTISQFEGYSGSNWSSLGGVRDVDGNTYIIPETSPAANENILYFYNNNVNTLQLTENALDFTGIDTITTSSGNSLEIDTSIFTLAGSETTIDNTDSASTFISTAKQYLDLGLSTGITVDPVLRLDDQGDVYLNVGFGTGSFTGVKIFDGDLKDFELADYALKTTVLNLVKGVSNSGSSILYNTANAKACKVTVISKSTSGKKSMAEYNVIDNGTDIFFTEIGSLNTSNDGFNAEFDITPSNETRVTLTLSNDHANNDSVEITVLTQVIK